MMKLSIAKRVLVLAVGAGVAMATVGSGGNVKAADSQKFKLSDLFKKSKSGSGKTKSKSTTSKTTTSATEKTAEKKAAPAATSTSKAATDTQSTASSSKQMSTVDQLKSLTGQLDKAGTDPDALLRSARARFLKLKEQEAASKKKPATVVKKDSSTKKTEMAKPSSKVESPTVAKSQTAPVKTSEKPVTTAVVTSASKPVQTSRVVDPSRPPSLAPLTTVAAATVITSREVPAENLQTSLAASAVPAPKPLVAKKQKKKSKSAPSAMEITSDEVEMDNEKHTTTFIGNVYLVHPTFNLRSDRLVIYMHDESVESEAPFKTAVATGARVIVERLNDKGGKDVGQSRKVNYDALTGDLILSGGPPQLQSGSSLVQTNSEEATITLKRDGNHSVKDKGSKKGGGAKIIIPVNGKKGAGSKGPNLMPSKLGDISSKRK